MKHQINAEIRIVEYTNGFGATRYSPVLPDGQRPYPVMDDLRWSSRDPRPSVALWTSRRAALRAGRRQWKRTLATTWTPVQA